MRMVRLRGLGDATSDAIAAAIGPDYTSSSITAQDLTGATTPPVDQSTSSGGMSAQDIAAMFPVSSSDVTTPAVATSAPSATTDPNAMNQMVTFAGQLYQYVQQLDANGNPIYVPQAVQSSGGIGSLLSNPVLLIGGALALFFALSG